MPGGGIPPGGGMPNGGIPGGGIAPGGGIMPGGNIPGGGTVPNWPFFAPRSNAFAKEKIEFHRVNKCSGFIPLAKYHCFDCLLV